jgi:hypothetical protein
MLIKLTQQFSEFPNQLMSLARENLDASQVIGLLLELAAR